MALYCFAPLDMARHGPAFSQKGKYLGRANDAKVLCRNHVDLGGLRDLSWSWLSELSVAADGTSDAWHTVSLSRIMVTIIHQ